MNRALALVRRRRRCRLRQARMAGEGTATTTQVPIAITAGGRGQNAVVDAVAMNPEVSMAAMTEGWCHNDDTAAALMGSFSHASSELGSQEDCVITGNHGGDVEEIAQTTESIAMDDMLGEAPDEVVDKVAQTLIVPEVGMTFDSEDKAYEMYNKYAGKVGFSIRKSITKRRADRTICQKYIVCSSKGHRENESSQKDNTRTGCNARVQFSVSRKGIWKVQKDHSVGQSSTMIAPLMQDGHVNATMPNFNFIPNFPAMAAPYMQGGYTNLLVNQDATLQSAVRKLHFDGVQNHENM